MPSGYLEHPLPLAFAHQGGAAHFPGNSWPAFEHAVELGFTYLETDVNATADGTALAFHDTTLDRLTDRTGRISQLTDAQVTAARIGGTEPIVVLADLLTAWPDVRFNLDVKDEAAIAPLAAVLHATNCWDRICLASFSGHRLGATRRLLDRRVCSATAPADIGALLAGLPTRILAARFAVRSIQCAQIPARLATRQFLHRAHAAGLQVHVWTINDAGEMASLLDRGVDGIVTDEIEMLRDLLIGRGQWQARTGSHQLLPARAPEARKDESGRGQPAARDDPAPSATAGRATRGSQRGARGRLLSRGGKGPDSPAS